MENFHKTVLIPYEKGSFSHGVNVKDLETTKAEETLIVGLSCLRSGETSSRAAWPKSHLGSIC